MSTAQPTLAVTFFTSFAATAKKEETLTLSALATKVRTTSAREKKALPWLKLARFGEIKTPLSAAADGSNRMTGGSLRHDANVLAITGIEVDYDGEKIPVDDAVERLTKNGLLSMVYTSPSHKDAAPRWRVLCPTSQELPPEKRKHLVGRINGIFGGTLANESWTLSQSYYLGSVNHNPAHRVEIIDGEPIDSLDELDETWCGPPQTQQTTGTRIGAVDEAALLQAIVEGKSYHEAAVRLLGRWARQRVPYMDARKRLTDAMETVFPLDRDARWHDRMADVDRCLTDIYGKEARKRDARDEAAADTATSDYSPREEPEGFGDVPPHGDSAAGADSSKRGWQPLYVITPDQCVTAPMRNYIVKGLIAHGDHCAVIGLPGSGKSILAPYVGYRASLGLDVFGHRTRAVTVLYLAAEDGSGMTMRVRALHDRMGNSHRFLLEPVPVDLLSPDSPHVAAVEKLIEDHQPGLIILDTVPRAFPGLRENDPDGMGHVVKVARGFTAICNSAVVSIHHPPKAGEKTPRGHSNFHGDLDATFYIEGEKRDPRHVSMGKNRNGPSDVFFSFNLGVQEFELDDDGDPVTAPVAEPVEGPSRPKAKLTPTERNAVTFLADLLCDEGQPMPRQPGFPNHLHGVDETRWREECERRRLSTADTPKDRSRVFRKVSGDLRNKGAVGICDGWVWLITSAEGG